MTALWHEVSGRPMPRVILPLWAAWGLLPMITLGARLAGKEAPLNAGILRASVSNREVSHAKAAAELGFTQRPIREGLVDALAFFETRGWLREGAQFSA